jgi:hypothetical protein
MRISEPLKLIFSLLLCSIILSCSIIEDSDITSKEEFDNLRFKSVSIKQETSQGNNSMIANVTSRSEVSIPTPNGLITETFYMDWPALTGKLKLKGGYTASFKTYTSFLGTGKPYTFSIFDSDSVLLELYRFRYDASGRLVQIITNVPFVEGGPPTSNDTLYYGNANNMMELTSIVRRSSDPSKAGTFTLASTGGSIFSTGWSFDFKGTRYSKACQGNGCGEYYGGNYHIRPSNGGQPFGLLNVTDSQRAFVNIEDNNKPLDNYGCSNCIRYSDTFYFHPLMILKDQLVFTSDNLQGGNARIGDVLFFIYMVDWWNPISAQETSNNEKIVFEFKYDL